MVLGYWPTNEPWGNLKVGDQLIRVGRQELRGVCPLRFYFLSYQEVNSSLQVSVVLVRAGKRHHEVLSLKPYPLPWKDIPITLSFVATVVLLLLRRPGSRLMRFLFLTSLTVSFLVTPFEFNRAPIAPIVLTYAWAALSFVSSTIWAPLSLRTALLFTEQGPRASIRLPWWPWLYVVNGPVVCSWMIGIVRGPPNAAGHLMFIAWSITCLLVLTRGFLRSDPVGRRQIKWLVYGEYLGIMPMLFAEAVTLLKPSLVYLDLISPIFLVFIPICGVIAILRFNLFDIDRLIGATAAYTIGSIVMIAAMFMVVPRLSEATTNLAGLNPAAGEVVVSLLLATVVVPGTRYLRPQIERLFFAERYALELGVEDLLRELSACTSPNEVLTLAGERLDFYLRPECCVIYGRSAKSYAPLFFRGPTVAPVLDAEAALVTALHSETRPVEVEPWLRRYRPSLLESDRAILQSLGAAVVVPIHCVDMIAAFLCLGHKRSGDIYTATDLTLLTRVADKVSAELRRFDEAEIGREVRAMSDALRRYVPEPIAEQILTGQKLDARESEVSVLFVDIRGYTSYAEDKSAAEVFSTVSHYTKTVSRVVRAHGGTVVEFNGDGMMAVFGAPAPVAEKEHAAVRAGLEIVLSMRCLDLGAPIEQPLEVGVGIATGKAFVGNIQSIDRLIWSAIGVIVKCCGSPHMIQAASRGAASFG